MSTEKLVRITSLIYRKKGISDAEFYHYWTQVHAPLVTDFMLRHGVVAYRQYHTPPETKKLGDAMAKAMGRELLSCDGLADVYVKDFKTFEDAFKDPEYLEKIRPDELAFLDTEAMILTIGYDYVVLEDGKLVESHERTF